MGLFNRGERGSAPMKRDALSRRGSAELARKSFSMTVGALEKALLKEFPAEDAEGWDRTGLLVGERALPVARVANIPALLKELKERGGWVFGAAAEGSVPLYEADLKGPAAIVIGNEGDGMGRLVRESCDVLVSIPMRGRISSLNASAAAAVLLYEAVRQRR